MKPKTLSFIITDLRTRRLAGVKKETFEELLKSTGIPFRHFCRCSFATWDVLLRSEVLVVKLAGSNVSTKHFRLQPEYRGKRQIRITVCNVTLKLNGDVLAAYLSAQGSLEEVTDWTAHEDFVLNVCVDREGFQATLHILTYKDLRGPADDGGCGGQAVTLLVLQTARLPRQILPAEECCKQ